MIEFVNAKINLGLNIVRKRDDGYHELETVFYPVGVYNGTPENPQPFSDILEIHLRKTSCEDEFYFSGNRIDCPLEKNLVYKAVKLFKDNLGEPGRNLGFSLYLEKHLPDGAGLGGGSADASFTLKIINRLAGNSLGKKELLMLAAKLGADCPFFIENRPVFAAGIGEIMTPIALDLAGWWAVIVKPDIHISTKEAFNRVVPTIPHISLKQLILSPVEDWEKEGICNDFEKSIFPLYPELEGIKKKIKLQGAAFAAMSGSGSSIFGLFRDKEEALQALTSFPCKTFLSKL